MTDLPDDLQELLAGMPSPREHHYGYAHQALPGLVFRVRPSAEQLEKMVSEGLFREFWDEVGGLIEGNRLSGEGLESCMRQRGELRAALVKLPPAEVDSEAHMVAVVSEPYTRFWFFTGHRIRYFTLEKGLAFDEASGLAGERTVLCEWTGQSHSNYGDGPEATMDAFAGAVFDLLGQ